VSGFHDGELSEVECRDRVPVPVLVRGRIVAIEGVVAP
jgi:hypothetical protein